jgi:MscS family membrane protein
MDYIREFFPPVFREWVEAIVVVAVTIACIVAYRTIVGRLKNRKGWHLAWELASYVSYLGYAIGIRLFVQVAPIPMKSEVYLDDIAYTLTVFILLITIRRAVLYGFTHTAARTAHSSTFQHGFLPLLRNLVTLFLFLSGGIMVLKHFNYDVMSLLTALGVGSLAVGLAAKETLANMISGFMLILDRNLKAGDRISFKGTVGDVQEIGLRSTRILSGDGNQMIVPNFDLVNNTIINLSEPSRAGICSTQIRMPFTADFKKIQALCLSILSKIQKVDQTRGKWANLSSLNDGDQVISIGCWLHEMDDGGEVLTAFHQELLKELATQKISLSTRLPLWERVSEQA